MNELTPPKVLHLKAAEPLPPEINQNIVERLKNLLSLAEKGEVHSLLMMYEKGDTAVATETIGVGCTAHLLQYIAHLEVAKMDMVHAVLDSAEDVDPNEPS